ncbi:hypothetical protein DOQ08_00815 [Marinobacter litoralis]|uniref:Glycosyl transferases group 1 n=1 Tax=Marinobacter litoralis TaxID=187981 RepID=A0A3M2RLA4_9GAMM|nr:glycosyltransferase family 1 protein [Marinobacter litoralis]RMJ06130.1 hypothetical protein DOQ08_00815 [Marinobacter litoralis]
MKVNEEEKNIWLSWEHQRRNRSLSKCLGFELFELVSDKGMLARYCELAIKTTVLLLRVKPDNVVCQNPSIVLVTLCIILRAFLKYTLIIDCHNSGLYPKEGAYRILNYVFIKVNAIADIVIVSNENLKEKFKSYFEVILVIPDPLPDRDSYYTAGSRHIIDANHWNLDGDVKFLFICSWAQDEPYNEVIEAFADHRLSGVSCYITGSPGHSLKGTRIPKNISLTGFISDEDYFDLLCKCDAVLVLTNRDDCLTCGAYEALAVGKTGILSDSEMMRSTFGEGYLYSKPEKDDILNNVLLLADNIEFFYAGVRASKSGFNDKLLKSLQKFKDAVFRARGKSHEIQ